MNVTWDQALAWRVQRHLLDSRAGEGAVEVARRLCGVHAQVMSSAELAIRLRAREVSAGDVQDALWDQRSLVKTWAMRGTLHLLPADELPMWVAGFSTRTSHLKGSWLKYHKVTAEDLRAILDTIPTALDCRCLTRTELAAEVARLSGRSQLKEQLNGSWGAVLKPAAFQGLLAFGPSEGRNVTFVSPRQWIGGWQDVDTDTALAEILRRFLDTYGPSTREDFARWFAMEPRPARQLFERLADELVEVDVEGHAAWMTRDSAKHLAETEDAEVIRLLPGFDPYVVGALRHLEHLLPGPFRDRISRTSGWISPVLLSNGRIAGTWRHDWQRERVQLEIEPFTSLPKRVRVGTEGEAATIGELLDAPVDVSWSG